MVYIKRAAGTKLYRQKRRWQQQALSHVIVSGSRAAGVTLAGSLAGRLKKNFAASCQVGVFVARLDKRGKRGFGASGNATYFWPLVSATWWSATLKNELIHRSHQWSATLKSGQLNSSASCMWVNLYVCVLFCEGLPTSLRGTLAPRTTSQPPAWRGP